MKKTILGILLALSTSTFSHAAFVTCNSDYDHYDDNKQVLLIEKVNGECKIHNPLDLSVEEKIHFEIDGIGPGFRVDALENIMFFCPTALRKNLTLNDFYGVKAEASALIGPDVGVFANKRGGTCILIGVASRAIGAGISGARLRFTDI